MTSIRILPDILSNQIAAGEVVERPASVVKELMENSIDAGADQIRVEIGQGGKSLIQVSDNGMGMDHDDALLSIERYATSKIRRAEDLHAIASLGFRGEALPSIAAVSRFRMVTRSSRSDAATEIVIEGGKIKAVNQTGAPAGTLISVGQLFFNTPARRKFLKTANTEMGHISETVACVALSAPDIGFRLVHNNKTVRDWPKTDDPMERAVDVLGNDFRPLLYPLDHQGGRAEISGWIADPSATRSSTSRIYVFVNGRFIRDRGIIYALCEGFRGRLMKGRFPVAVVFLKIPHQEVDINVHPAKQEVRFLNQRQVLDAVRRAVENAWQQPPRPRPKADAVLNPPPWEQSSLFEPKSSYVPDQSTAFKPKTAPLNSDPGPKTPHEPAQAFFEPGFLSKARVIGQFKNTYIVCEKPDELLLIDQHAAHERILYEKLSRLGTRDKTPAQRLLMPETIELTYKQAPLMEQLLPELGAMGFEMEPFGDRTFVVQAVPEMLGEEKISDLVADMAEAAETMGSAPELSRLLDRCLIVMACHGAIRANQALTDQEMSAMIEQLNDCENPFHCPHGRPTVIRWPLSHLEKRFRRVV
jgi:DNA mismatch repair protein MutL